MGAELWEGHVAAAKRETISAREFASRHNILVADLYYWQRKLKVASASTHTKVLTLAKPAHGSPFVDLHVLDKSVCRLA